MTIPLWSGTVEMRWDGHRLMVARVCIGSVYHGSSDWFTRSEIALSMRPYATEALARSALVAAAVRALGGEA